MLQTANARLESQLGQEKSKAAKAESERNSALIRIQRIGEVLKEERVGARATDSKVAVLSDELRTTQLEIAQLRTELEAVPSGPAGLLGLVFAEIERESLRRDTTQGRTQRAADERCKQLEKIQRDLLSIHPELALRKSRAQRHARRKWATASSPSEGPMSGPAAT